MKMFLIGLMFFMTQWPPFAFAEGASLDLGAHLRPQIRNQIRQCQTLLIESGQADDSVGIPFSTNNPEEFRAQVAEAVAKYGLERFRSGTFFVLGVQMRDEAATLARFNEVLEASGLNEVGAEVKVLSVPSNLIREESVSLARDILERVRYFWPSITRDAQAPQMAEIHAGWMSTAVLEVPTVIFLYSSLPALDANMTAISHAVILGAYTIYSKSMLNWLLRPGFDKPSLANIELFFKQMALSAPFVANYNIFGKFSEITQYYVLNGWAKTMQAFPHELAAFATTQGLTVVLQTIFYSQVITKGFGGWVNNQVGEDNSRVARASRPWLQAPILMADAVVLAMASSSWGEPLLTIGPMELNWGHAGLIAMTASASFIFNKFPDALNKTIPVYKWLERFGRGSKVAK